MAQYLPDPGGDSIAFIRGDAVLLVPQAATSSDLWTALDADDPTAAVLDALTSGGLGSAPHFAFVVRADETVRAVVRGAFTVDVGGDTLSGAHVSTFAERSFAAAEVAVWAGGVDARPEMSHAVALELIEGMALASLVTSSTGERRALAPDVEAPEPATAPTATRSVEIPSFVSQTLPGPPVNLDESVARTATTVPLGGTQPASDPERTMVPVEETIAPAADSIDSIEETVVGLSIPPRRVGVFPDPSTTENGSANGGGADAGSDVGDHDGLTIAGAGVDRLRAERAAQAAASDSGSGRGDSPRLHQTQQVGLRMPGGALEPIEHDVVVGRAPSPGRVSGLRLPKLVTIGVGDPDISRSHVRFTLEGDTVVVTDLDSRNGTTVLAQGLPPVRLRGGEAVPVLVGTTIDLGGGWTMSIEAI